MAKIGTRDHQNWNRDTVIVSFINSGLECKINLRFSYVRKIGLSYSLCLYDGSRLFGHSEVPPIAKWGSYETTCFGINIRDGQPYEIFMDYISDI